MVAPIPFRRRGETPKPTITRGLQIPLPKNNLPLHLAFIQSSDHQSAVSNEKPHSGQIPEPVEVTKRCGPTEVQGKIVIPMAAFLKPLGWQVAELGGKVHGDDEIATRGETKGQAWRGVAKKVYRRLVVNAFACLVQFLHHPGTVEINAGDVGSHGFGLAAVAGQMQDIGQDYLLETDSQLGQRHIVDQAAPQNQGGAMLGAGIGGSEDGVAAAGEVRLPACAVSLVALFDGKLFAEKAHPPEMAGTGGEQAFQPESDHHKVMDTPQFLLQSQSSVVAGGKMYYYPDKYQGD